MCKSISIEWRQINTVFLDMDGTLLDLHYDNFFWYEYLPIQYAKKYQLSIEDAKNQLNTRYSACSGTLDWYCLDYWSNQLGLDIENLKYHVIDRIQVRSKVKIFLQFLNNIQKRVILLTNAHPKVIDIKLPHTTLEQYFDAVISSHTLGLAKEQLGFWDELHKIENFSCEDSMFIDDNLQVLHTARHHGLIHLFAIQQPDSRKDFIDTDEFILIESFSQMISNY